MIRGEFRFGLDSTLGHLAQVHDTDYEVYRPREGWVSVRILDPILIAPGDFLVFRPEDYNDDHCHNIGALIRMVHTQLARASPYETLRPIPLAYRY